MKVSKWVIIEIINKDNIEHYYKLFATINNDEWRLNSGITEIIKQDNDLIIKGQSGSSYVCKVGSYGVSEYTGGVLDSMIKKASEMGIKINILNENTDFLNLIL